MPELLPRTMPQRDAPTGRQALAGSMTRPDFLRDTAATHALLRRADRAYGFVGDTVAMPALLPRTMPQRDAPTGRWALAGSRTRPGFYSKHSTVHALLRRADRAYGFVGDTVAMPATTLRLTPQRVLAAEARPSCGEQTAPMVLLVTLPRRPRFCLE